MAVFSLTIADWDVARVLTALSVAGGYPDVTDVNAKEYLMDYIRTTVANVEAAQIMRMTPPTLPPVDLS